MSSSDEIVMNLNKLLDKISCTKTEAVNMIHIYILCRRNPHQARKKYAMYFPQHRLPERWMFCYLHILIQRSFAIFFSKYNEERMKNHIKSMDFEVENLLLVRRTKEEIREPIYVPRNNSF